MDHRRYRSYRRFRYSAGGAAQTRASQQALFDVVSDIGGENRYYTLNALWTVRELMDAALGGNGLRHARPHDRELRPGDRIDSWEVLDVVAPTHLALIFGMRAPGRGVLAFDIDATRRTNRLTATAYWEPDGLAGVLYWRAMQPAHLVLFDRLTQEICRRALDAEHGSGTHHPHTAASS
ncbi:DUF2867 domain-containing protein [Rhodovibrio salinarum]|nr:DUF2867 domain-containing protein [Rhodovibrio salinarum]